MGAGLRRPRPGGDSSIIKRLVPLGIVVAVGLWAALALAMPALSGSRTTPAPAAASGADRTAANISLVAQATSVPADQVAAQARAGVPAQAVAPAAAARAEIVREAGTRAVDTQAAEPVPAVQAQSSLPAPTVTTVRYGPIPVLPALLGIPTHTMAGAPLVANLPLVPMPCSNCYVTGTTIDMVYDNGQQANLDTGVMLHHLVLFQPQIDDATCARTTPIGLFGQRFFAAGNERTSGTLPDGYGLHFGTGPLGAYFDIMNHSDQLKLVYLTASVSWLPDTTPGVKPVTPVWLDQNNCSTSTYAIPAGPTTRTWRWTSTMTGRFVTAAGHVHDGGIEDAMMNETTGEHICSSVAGYGTKPAYMGSVESMSVCSWDRLGTVRRGDTIAFDTTYNSPQPQNDVMGIMIAYLYQTDDLSGGTQAPMSVTDPDPTTTTPPAGHTHHG